MTHQEIRHSHFLAFLMNPRESHQLGDAFVKRFLTHATISDEARIEDLNAARHCLHGMVKRANLSRNKT